MLKDAQGAAPAPAGGVEAVAPKPAPPGRGHNHPHIEFKFFAELKHRNVVRVDRSCMPRNPVRVGIAGTQLLLAPRYDITNAMYCDNSKGGLS